MGALRIALDATYSTGGNLSGVGVYSRELLHALAAQYPNCEWLWCYRPHRFWKALGEQLPHPAHRRPLLERWTPRADAFHGLSQRLPKGVSGASAVTFHDLFVMTGEYSTPEFRKRFTGQAREAAARARLLIAVSEFTATQIHELLGVERSRIRVIHHGVRWPPASAPAAREKIVLTVGAVQKRKNTARLVRAFAATPARWKLVIVGARGYGWEETAEAIERSTRRSDIEWKGWLDDVALADLYARASVFAFPSLDEGFGMPVIEAMSRELPVLTSNRSSLPEVSGGAAMEVDPFDEAALGEALRLLCQDESRRDRLGKLGLARARSFTWEETARQSYGVYRELAAR